MAAYLGNKKVWESPVPAAPVWERPSDWLDLPEVSPTEEKIVALHAVWPDASNFCAFKCEGDYVVDWGDGTVETIASGTKAIHTYDYAQLSAATASERGYRQAVITITPAAGHHISNVSFGEVHPTPAPSGGYFYTHGTGWLDVLLSIPYCTAFTFDGPSTCSVLERVVFLSSGKLTSLANVFAYQQSLAYVDLSGLDTSLVTSFSGLFGDCYGSLKYVNMSGLDTSSVTDFSYVFGYCFNLESVDLSGLDFSNVTDMNSLFYYCHSLDSVSFAGANLGKVTTLASAFQSCYSLKEVDFSGSNLVSIVDLANAFRWCDGLKRVDFTGCSFDNVSVMAGMFTDCDCLQTIVFPEAMNLSNVVNFHATFASCTSLRSLDLSGVRLHNPSINGASLFSGCYSLASLKVDLDMSFSVGSRALSATALNALYESLPTVVGKTITVSGNYGVSGSDPSIATAKGWTVVG